MSAVRETWFAREIPLLEAIAELADELDHYPSLAEVRKRAQIDPDDADEGMRALFEAGYITGVDVSTQQGLDLLDVRLTGDGRVAVGQWPSDDPIEALVQRLDQLIAATEKPEDKGRLERLRDAVADASKHGLGELIGRAMIQTAGLG